MFDFKELEAFVWIVRLGSFRMAAQHLHLTQPSISDRIARLEGTLGEQVLQRNQRPIQPTLRGRELFRQAEKMLAARQDAIQLFRDEHDYQGVFRLGVVETIAQSWLPAFLGQLSQRFPAMTLEMDVDTTPRLTQRLTNHELDLAFLMGPILSDTVMSHALCSYPIGFIVHPDILKEWSGPAVEILEHYPLITFSRDSQPYQDLRSLLHEIVLDEARVHCSSSLWTIVRLTQARFGIGVIPPMIVQSELARGELALLELPCLPPALNFTSSWPLSHDSRIAESIAHLALDFTRQHSNV